MSEFKKFYNSHNSPIYGISKKRREKIFKLLGNTGNKKILDIGCGEGYLGAAIAKNNNYIVGVDISRKSVEKAKIILNDAVVLDIQEQKVPYPNKYFDVIVITEVIEHLLVPEKVLEEASRLLKDDGFMIITTPNFLLFSNRIKILFGKFEYTKSGFFDRGHIHFFHINSFEKMLKQTELKVVEYDHVYYGKIPELIQKIFPKLFVFQIVAKVSKK